MVIGSSFDSGDLYLGGFIGELFEGRLFGDNEGLVIGNVLPELVSGGVPAGWDFGGFLDDFLGEDFLWSVHEIEGEI